MDKQAIKELMYGGIREIMNNNKFYYHSTISKNYSGFTETGHEVVKQFVIDMASYIREAEDQDLDQRAKKIMLDELKKT